MNKEDLNYIKELKLNGSCYAFDDRLVGIVRLLIIYKGEGLFFQENGRALICEISARNAIFNKGSLKEWDDGTSLDAQDKERVAALIAKYYTLAYKDELTLV
ncbi:hypothetical protein NUV26_34195 [Burkholderia pseudomultivorans]|uniref:hypothetical protein n=1 Tax=Burkholderia pseudomultivorans TaxID=1207504 RepID=UPI002875BA5A|nr:hypothetical protein [Burkholderia pseudomultivorans]MDS0797217.1 hypothetical protein [Burkholderia pseudomultivorans]